MIDLAEILRDLGFRLSDRIRDKLLSSGKSASGALVNSIGFQTFGRKDSNKQGVNMLASIHWRWVDKGRKASGKRPPFQPIYDWVRAKIGGDEKVAWAIINYLKDHDTKGTNIFTNESKITEDEASLIQRGFEQKVRDSMEQFIIKNNLIKDPKFNI